MGVLAALAGPILKQLSSKSTGIVAACLLVSLILLATVLNILNQLLYRNPNEPPLVFHWFPVIGSTISYGLDPYQFFFRCREKVLFARIAILIR